MDILGILQAEIKYIKYIFHLLIKVKKITPIYNTQKHINIPRNTVFKLDHVFNMNNTHTLCFSFSKFVDDI